MIIAFLLALQVEGEEVVNGFIDIPPVYVSFIVGPALVPLLTMLLVYVKASTRVKILVNAFVAAVVSLVATNVVPNTGYAIISWESLGNALIAFLSSSTAYSHFWQPVAKIDQATWLAINKGIGKKLDQPTVMLTEKTRVAESEV